MATRIAQAIERNLLYVSNIPWTIGSKELKNYFVRHGEIIQSKIIFNKETGLSRGYGFIQFKDETSLNSVLQLTHSLEGKTLMVRLKN